MKILLINSVCGILSTGRICANLAAALEQQGHEVKIAYGRGKVPKQFQKYAVPIGGKMDVAVHAVKARLFDQSGFGSRNATSRLIQWIKQYNPDVIHLHNLHGYYIHIGLLFGYLRDCGKKVIWTLHDCWPMTGHCAYFDYIGCRRWKDGCFCCPQRSEYPKSWLMDCSNRNYIAKKRLFSGIDGLLLVSPSHWLAKLAKQSYLRSYQTVVIHNGVDTSVFRPTSSNLRSKFYLNGKKVILGVAAVWDGRKGLDSFIALAGALGEGWQIVLIGLSKRQIKKLPVGILGLERLDSAKELAAWYTLADVYVNPTLEDNYPTTNIEAIACGTPVVTYQTGGSAEGACLFGITVKKHDVRGLAKAVKNACGVKMQGAAVDVKEAMGSYLALYEDLGTNG